jgi:P22 coat protein - gene protein 5
MAGNSLLTISMITREAARILTNNLCFTKQIRTTYSDEFARSGAKIGSVLNIRKPPKYIGRTGRVCAIEDVVESSVPLALTTQFGVDMAFSSAELALSIDDFSDRILKPAVAVVANKIDFDMMGLYTSVPNVVGAAGTVPNTLLTYLMAGVALDDNMAPRDNQRAVVVNPIQQATIVDALKGLFQSADQIEDQYEKGTMGITAGFKWCMDQNTRVHTAGAYGGAPIVSGGSQVGSSLLVSGFTAAAAPRLKKGDMFTLAGVNAVNGQNRQDLGYLRTFTVTADVSSAADGTATIPIYPPITPTGASQTVTASPAGGAPLTMIFAANSKTAQALAFHKDAFTYATADLPLPDGVDMASRVSDSQLGVSVRMIRQYQICDDVWPTRLDVLYGIAPVYPELACRIIS